MSMLTFYNSRIAPRDAIKLESAIANVERLGLRPEYLVASDSPALLERQVSREITARELANDTCSLPAKIQFAALIIPREGSCQVALIGAESEMGPPVHYLTRVFYRSPPLLPRERRFGVFRRAATHYAARKLDLLLSGTP